MSPAQSNQLDKSTSGLPDSISLMPKDNPKYSRLAIEVTFLLAVIPTILWPGDIPWIYDEPAEVAIALNANQNHTLASHALSGNFSVSYGPLPIHINQLFLLFSHDPRVLVILRAILCSTVLAASLLWLARSMGLTPWFAAAVVLAPYLWHNNRIPWAANLAMPVGVLAVAAYASFLRFGSGPSLLLALGAGIAPPLIHPQAAPLTAAIVGHMLLFRRRALWQNRLGVLATLALLTIINFRYVRDTAATVYRMLRWSISTGHPASHISRMQAALGPLMGGRLFAGGEFDITHLHLSGPSLLILMARILSSISIPLVWAGVALTLWQQICPSHATASSPDRTGTTDSLSTDPSGATGGLSTSASLSRNTLLRIALASLLIQSFYFGLLRVPSDFFYFFGSFGIDVLFAWIAVDALARFRLRTIAIAAYGLSLAIITLDTMWQVHQNGWAYDYTTTSPTLNNQIEIARELNYFADTSALTDVVAYQFKEPNALWTLRQLFPADSKQPRRLSGRLVVRHGIGPNGPTCQIELIEAKTQADIPSNAKPVALHPPAIP